MTEAANIYAFNLKDIDGQDFPMARFAGRPLVIANTASECGFTPQYAGLQQLWRDRQNDGLIVIGVPSNDFGGQEPGDHATIATFCRGGYGTDFPLTQKLRVTGPEAHPLFKWLTEKAGFLGQPRWNFYKYLIDREGQLADWFTSPTTPGSKRFRRAVDRIVARS